MENRELDQLFQAALEEEMVFYDQERQWKRVETRLEKDKKRRFWWWWMGSGLLGALTFMLVTIYSLESTTSANSQLINIIPDTVVIATCEEEFIAQVSPQSLSESLPLPVDRSSSPQPQLVANNNQRRQILQNALSTPDHQRHPEAVLTTGVGGETQAEKLADNHLNQRGEMEPSTNSGRLNDTPATTISVSLVQPSRQPLMGLPIRSILSDTLRLPTIQSRKLPTTRVKNRRPRLRMTEVAHEKHWTVSGGTQVYGVNVRRFIADSTRWGWYARLDYRPTPTWFVSLSYATENINRLVGGDNVDEFRLPVPLNTAPAARLLTTAIKYNNRRIRLGVGKALKHSTFRLGYYADIGFQLTQQGKLRGSYLFSSSTTLTTVDEEFPASDWYLSELYIRSMLQWRLFDHWGLAFSASYFAPLARNEIHWKRWTETSFGLFYYF